MRFNLLHSAQGSKTFSLSRLVRRIVGFEQFNCANIRQYFTKYENCQCIEAIKCNEDSSAGSAVGSLIFRQIIEDSQKNIFKALRAFKIFGNASTLKDHRNGSKKGGTIRSPLVRNMMGTMAASNSPCTLLKPNSIYRQQSVRTLARGPCAEWCSESTKNLNLKHLIKHPTMWHNPTGCRESDCEPVIRHDVIHMPGSDKKRREYQRTWNECPPKKICPKRYCCPDLIPPPICRRPKKLRPKTADCMKQPECELRILKCPKFAPICCRRSPRDPPVCKLFPTPCCCQKRCTPYPSFSECCKPPSHPKVPVECLCLMKPTLCEILAHYRRMGRGH